MSGAGYTPYTCEMHNAADRALCAATDAIRVALEYLQHNTSDSLLLGEIVKAQLEAAKAGLFEHLPPAMHAARRSLPIEATR